MKSWKKYLRSFGGLLVKLTNDSSVPVENSIGNNAGNSIENSIEKNISDTTNTEEDTGEEIKEDRKELLQQNSSLGIQNQKLEAELRKAHETLGNAKTSLEEARTALKQLAEPPNSYGTILQVNEPNSTEENESVWTADVYSANKKMRVTIDPRLIDKSGQNPKPGQEVLLSGETMNIVGVLDEESSGEVVSLKEVMEDKTRAVVIGKGDDERVLELSESLKNQPLKPGDTLLANLRSNILLERLPKSEVEDLILEEILDITYENVAGLDTQIEQIRDAVELPFLHRDLFSEHKLPAPKGILLYGPPGCGKTLIAKAVANSLAQSLKLSGEAKANSSFINIKGPELLNKYVGETERQIRLIFQRAREKSKDGHPVVIFFDEMESLFRMRGTGISSDMESTVVPQLLSEIDGLESLKNVIVIGASNREELIDPAILRPGRLDVKIKIERPDEQAAQAIFACYLVEELPIAESEIEKEGGGDKAKAIQSMIEKTVTSMYSTEEENNFLEVTYLNGDKEVMYYKDFSSGAMIENIVRRAKKLAIKRYLKVKDEFEDSSEKIPDEISSSRGICLEDLLLAVSQEFKEHEDLPNTTNPDDWAKISGKKGQRISFVRTLLKDASREFPEENIKGQQGSGQYL